MVQNPTKNGNGTKGFYIGISNNIIICVGYVCMSASYTVGFTCSTNNLVTFQVLMLQWYVSRFIYIQHYLNSKMISTTTRIVRDKNMSV